MKQFMGVYFRNRKEVERMFDEAYGENNTKDTLVRFSASAVMALALFFVETPKKILAALLDSYSTFCELVMWTTNPMVLKDTKAKTEEESP